MRIPRIYTAQLLQGNASIELEPGPSQHIARVLRMRAGDELILFNGQGGEYPAEITAIDKKTVAVLTRGQEMQDCESSLAIHLGIAVSRGDRMDWIVQKATELGVYQVAPLFTERTEVKLSGERADKKTRHWQQIANSACEQCGRNRVPTIHPLQTLDSWLSATRAEQKFVLHHRPAPALGTSKEPGSIALLVGPEGGLSTLEIEAAVRAGYQSMRLGPRVLRTETAPLAAIAILQARWGDMQPQ